MGFQPEVYNPQQVQHVCPFMTILDIFVASNIDQSLQKYHFLVYIVYI